MNAVYIWDDLLTLKEPLFKSIYQTFLNIVLSNNRQAMLLGADSCFPLSNVQQFFKIKFNVLINEEYSICAGIKNYYGVLEHAIAKVDFSIGAGTYVLQSNPKLNVRKNAAYNNKILVSSKDIGIIPNRKASEVKVYY